MDKKVLAVNGSLLVIGAATGAILIADAMGLKFLGWFVILAAAQSPVLMLTARKRS